MNKLQKQINELKERVEGIYKSVHGIEPNKPDIIIEILRKLFKRHEKSNPLTSFYTELLEMLNVVGSARQTEKKDCKECKHYKGFHSSWCEGKGLGCVNQAKFKKKKEDYFDKQIRLGNIAVYKEASGGEKEDGLEETPSKSSNDLANQTNLARQTDSKLPEPKSCQGCIHNEEFTGICRNKEGICVDHNKYKPIVKASKIMEFLLGDDLRITFDAKGIEIETFDENDSLVIGTLLSHEDFNKMIKMYQNWRKS